jgi:hypothetical protein
MQGENVTPDLSRLSLIDRARLAALIEADGDTDLRQHLLGAIGRSETTRGARLSNRAVVPEGWTQIHVLDRMEEAYGVLASQPGGGKARSSSVWPAMAAQQLSILDQIELMETGELEQRQQDQNRVRLAPTSLQISLMEQALAWPFQFLHDRPELAKAIQLRTMWAAMGADIRKRGERAGLHHDIFNSNWQQALAIITGALIARKVPVS